MHSKELEQDSRNYIFHTEKRPFIIGTRPQFIFSQKNYIDKTIKLGLGLGLGIPLFLLLIIILIGYYRIRKYGNLNLWSSEYNYANVVSSDDYFDPNIEYRLFN